MAVVLVALVATAIVFFGSTGGREVNRPMDWFSAAEDSPDAMLAVIVDDRSV